MKSKFILIFLLIFTTNFTYANEIESVYPLKCQEYIVSRPTIEANFKNDINLDSIKLYVNYVDVTNMCKIDNNKISYIPNEKFKRGTQIAKLIYDEEEFEWYFSVGTPTYTHYRGLLHAHTSMSDGHGSFEDAYSMAYKANLDFFAITEHSNYLEYKNLSDINNSNSQKWNDLIKVRDKFSQNNKFIALNGFEMTYPIDKKIGHINIFNSNGFVSSKDSNLNLENFYKLLSQNENLIGQFNHPCDKFGTFNNLSYNKDADSVMCLLEVGNGYKSNLSENILSFDMYQLALDNGWHVAPTCNQDNHLLDFAVANEFRTVILASNLDRDSLYDAMKNMRVYATQDNNLEIDFTINDLVMGSSILNPSKLKFSITAIDKDLDDSIKKIEVITENGQVLNSMDFNSNVAKFDFTINSTKETFYYVKVIQNNDKISVTAPIWTKK